MRYGSQIILDTGISMGDEGKGRLIPEVIRDLARLTGQPSPVDVVLKVNGGANSGHTAGGLKLNLFPAGVIETSVPVLAIGSGVVADPHKFLWEAAYIEHHGHAVLSRLLIDERTMVSDIAHRLLDLAWEYYRESVLGEERRGSTARGISPAYGDETAHFPIYYSDFRGDRERFARKLRGRLERAAHTICAVCRVPPERWAGFFETLQAAELRAHQPLIDEGILPAAAFDFMRFAGSGPFRFADDVVIDAYWQAGQRLLANIGDVRERLLAALARGKFILGEFGQAFWLDKRFGFPPNVTASHTLPAEFFLSAGVPLQPVHIMGVCKAYDTKVGTHVFVSRFPADHPLGHKLSKLEFGVTTGRQRMVGWYDAVEKGDALRYGGVNDLVINKLDALSVGDVASPVSELQVCVAYRTPDGTLLRHVPRDILMHRSIEPVYVAVPSWRDDIAAVRTFDNLPLAAKRYVATLVFHTLRVAYGDNPAVWPQTLPELPFIGVGPHPDQIVRGTPPLRELVSLAYGA
jgi:adenylosuccinate synthase